MSENPAGVLVVRDELTGWLAQLDRAGREGERAFCLSAWNGDCGHTIDRIKRGNIHVPHCCMSLLGGIQPARLRSYRADALADGAANDGLFQRFQVLVWPDAPTEWRYVDRPPDANAERSVAAIYRRLVARDSADPVRFRFAPDAQEMFIAWLAELEVKVRGDDLHPALASHLSKYRSLMPSLALLFELAEGGADGLVSLTHAMQAAAWCAYLESHAGRIYSCGAAPQVQAARELATRITAGKIGAGGYFTVREIYQKGWAGLASSAEAQRAVGILADAGWVPACSTEPGPSGGRPSGRYMINPRVLA